jgi:hypothetical protein
MKKGDLVKHCNAPWFGVITRVKRFKDPPAGIQHVELIWLDSGNRRTWAPTPERHHCIKPFADGQRVVTFRDLTWRLPVLYYMCTKEVHLED